MEFPDVFVDQPEVSRGWEHKNNTHTHTKVVVRTPLRPIPLALQQILQQKVDKGLQIRVTEPLEKSPSVSTQAGWLSECLSTLMSVMLTYASD